MLLQHKFIYVDGLTAHWEYYYYFKIINYKICCPTGVSLFLSSHRCLFIVMEIGSWQRLNYRKSCIAETKLNVDRIFVYFRSMFRSILLVRNFYIYYRLIFNWLNFRIIRFETQTLDEDKGFILLPQKLINILWKIFVFQRVYGAYINAYFVL